MSTTVRIRAQDKAFLDRIQARRLLATGERQSLDAILHKVLEVAARHENELMDDDAPPRLDDEQKRRLRALSYDFGTTTSPATIDEELYGGDDG